MGKTEETCFQAIGEEDVQERDHGVNLCKGIGAIGIIKLKSEQADSEIKKAGKNAGCTIPNRLSRQLFNAAQLIRFFKKDGQKYDLRCFHVLNATILPAYSIFIEIFCL